jgi:hypothetical protein
MTADAVTSEAVGAGGITLERVTTHPDGSDRLEYSETAWTG